MSKYSVDELMQCIYDCVTEDLQGEWKEAAMRADFSGPAPHPKVEFTALRENDKDHLPIEVRNFIAPINAITHYHTMEHESGERWNLVRIKLLPNGRKVIYRGKLKTQH